MIEVKNIEKSFGESKVLKGISTVFETGKTNLIIGQSGSGKTVLLKSLLGIFSPDAGTIEFDGRIYASLSNDEKRELRTEIGMVFQGSALFDSMTVAENVCFPLKMFTNNNRSETNDRVDFVLKRVNLIDAHHKLPSEISGGMQKRVAIARAIVNHPKYLFCDEPNSGLDPQTSMVIDKLIKEITVEYNITTIVVTHDMNSVMEIGDHILYLYNGKKQWEGTNKDIIFSKDVLLNNFIFASEFLQDAKEMRMMQAKQNQS